MSLEKFRGITPDQLDAVLASLTEAEFDEIETRFLNVISQLLIDELAKPLGLDWTVDANLLFCRLYRMSLDKTPGV